jgi:peptidoglycan/LPS O-acetylase OafA/YrhL
MSITTATDGASTEKLYWPQLDGFRTLAFLMVYLSHLPALPIPGEGAPPGLGFVMAFAHYGMQWGWIGVEMFFALSAFLITTLLLKERERFQAVSFKAFFTRRVLRIWPLYFGFIILSFFILPGVGFINFPLGSPPWLGMVQACLLPYLLFLANFCFTSPAAPVMPVYTMIPWSVAMEEQFYITWGAILARVKRLSTLWLIVFTALPCSILVRWSIQANSQSHKAYYYNTFSHLDAILVGIAIALLSATHAEQLRIWARRYGVVLFVAPILFYIYLILLVPRIQENDVSMVYYFSLIAVSSGAFLASVLYWPPAIRFFSLAPLARFGRITYGTYMFHLLALILASQLTSVLLPSGDPLLSWLSIAVLGLLLTWLISLASWHFLEKRFYEKRYRFVRVPSGFGVRENSDITDTTPALTTAR